MCKGLLLPSPCQQCVGPLGALPFPFKEIVTIFPANMYSLELGMVTSSLIMMGNAAYHLALILKRIHEIQTLTEGGNPFRKIAFNKAKCKYLAQELTTNIQPKIETSLMPSTAQAGDKVGSVLRHIAFAVANVERLVSRSCERNWWTEIFWMGDGSEAFGEVLQDLHAAMDIAINGNGSSRCGSELGQAWNSMVLQDRSLLMCNVKLMVEQKADLATGRILNKTDLELANHVMRRDHPENVIQLGMVRVVKRIVKGITCIRWHGKKCVMKSFLSDEFAKAEAAIMKDLMHPHVVLLIGFARRKNRFNPFSQPSPNILLEYAEQGDLRDYIQNLQDHVVQPDVIVSFMLEIAKGMQYIHSKKIAHLDLKSMNVFVSYHSIWDLRAANFFHVKIGDFGTAIRCDHDVDRPIPDWVYGQGTPRWRAPELFKEASRRSDLDLMKADVYSYAMVCVELLTKELPLQYRFPVELPSSSKVYEYVSVADNRPPLPDGAYPPQLLSIIRRCWDGEPSKRPSFENIVEALETLKKEMLLNDQFYSAVDKPFEVVDQRLVTGRRIQRIQPASIFGPSKVEGRHEDFEKEQGLVMGGYGQIQPTSIRFQSVVEGGHEDFEKEQKPAVGRWCPHVFTNLDTSEVEDRHEDFEKEQKPVVGWCDPPLSFDFGSSEVEDRHEDFEKEQKPVVGWCDPLLSYDFGSSEVEGRHEDFEKEQKPVVGWCDPLLSYDYGSSEVEGRHEDFEKEQKPVVGWCDPLLSYDFGSSEVEGRHEDFEKEQKPVVGWCDPLLSYDFGSSEVEGRHEDFEKEQRLALGEWHPPVLFGSSEVEGRHEDFEKEPSIWSYTNAQAQFENIEVATRKRKRKVRDSDDREAIYAASGEDDDESVIMKEASTMIMSPLFDIQTIHPFFNAHGRKMLIQLGEDVRRKIDDFVDGGATMGQHMYTSRAAQLQPILGEFQAQLHLLYHVDANNIGSMLLFDEVFNVLKKVEFLLGSCSWPAIEFYGGPTATDEAFLSVRKNLLHCVQMMKYSSSRLTFEEVSKFQSEVDPPDEETWSRACDSDRHMLIRFLSHSFPWNIARHRYLGSIAIISMFDEPPESYWIPFTVDKILLEEGPDGLIMGPVPFLPSETYASGSYYQRPVSWAVKVSTRKLAYDFIKLASLQHPHVVQMFGAWEYMGSEYVAMKMMQTNVMQFLSKALQEESLSAVLLLTILVQVAEGMAYMHSHHVRHHNLKCSNVLVGGFYKSLELVHVEVSDYGLEPPRRNGDSESNTSAVQFGEGVETDEYAFDVYQFALLCSKLFSIRGSQSADGGISTESAKLELDAVSFPVKCPRDLALYLHKCGSKDPKERPKFAEICTVLRTHKAYMILSGDQPASHGAGAFFPVNGFNS